jgi:rhodanese-related sulfurtransferase
MKRPIVQAVIIVLASLVLALTANALAGRQRKVMLVGWYPNAKTEAPRVEAAAPGRLAPAPMAAPVPATTTTAEAATRQPAIPATRKPSIPATPQPAAPKIELTTFQVHPDKPYIEIAFDDVKALHDKGVLFLDARRTSVYEQGHITGARPFSVWESDVDEKVNKFFEERSSPEAQALPIVVYCSGGDCEDSHMLAQKLWGIQFNNVYVYKDGFPDWQKRGGAVRTGAQP